MTLYFDTNIYNLITRTGEADSICKYFKSNGIQLIISNENLTEIIANSNISETKEILATAIKLSPKLESFPQSYLHAQELLSEVRRLKKNWLKKIIFRNSAKQFLASHPTLWQKLKSGIIPGEDVQGKYRMDVENGIKLNRDFQKSFKGLHQMAKSNNNDIQLMAPDGQIVPFDPTEPEKYWRLDAMKVWKTAILSKHPSTRDYYDWLSPYVKESAFEDPLYPDFWFSQVEGDNMPLNRMLGLVSFFQTLYKITHGNSIDEIHAGNFLLYDFFLTADKTFHRVLSEANLFLEEPLPPPILLDRNASSILLEIVKNIEEIE